MTAGEKEREANKRGESLGVNNKSIIGRSRCWACLWRERERKKATTERRRRPKGTKNNINCRRIMKKVVEKV